MSYHVNYPYEIWKHELNFDSIFAGEPLFKLQLPLGAIITKFAKQGNTFCIWEMHAVAHRDQLFEEQYWFTGTGHQIPGWLLPLDNEVHTLIDGEFVWHLIRVSDQRENMRPE